MKKVRNPLWVVTGDGAYGVGATPEEAQKDWRLSTRGASDRYTRCLTRLDAVNPDLEPVIYSPYPSAYEFMHAKERGWTSRTVGYYKNAKGLKALIEKEGV